MTFVTFQPNCTLPATPVDYVASPPIRTTLDIVWACLSTIVACTYTSLHLDVIADDCVAYKKNHWWHNTRRALRTLAVELAVACLSVIVPEWIATVAFLEWRDARELIRSTYELGNGTTKWTPRLARYATAGGFRLCRPTASSSGISGEMQEYEEIIIGRDAWEPGMKAGVLPLDPPISEAEVDDLSKQSIFAKILALWQITWFGINVIARLARHLPLSQLEVGTVGFVIISIPIWVMYFQKPKGVQFGTRIFGKKAQPNREAVQASEEDQGGRSGLASVSYLESIHYGHFNGRLTWYKRLHYRRKKSLMKEIQYQFFRQEFDSNDTELLLWIIFVVSIPALPFGAVHVAAWNASFPTVIDQWLWRVAAIITMLPFVTGGILCLTHLFFVNYLDMTDDWILKLHEITLPILYVIARLVLIVEMVRCLLNVPPEMFVTTWPNNLPHLG